MFVLGAAVRPVNALVPVFEVMYVRVLFEMLIKIPRLMFSFWFWMCADQKPSCICDDLFTALSCRLVEWTNCLAWHQNKNRLTPLDCPEFGSWHTHTVVCLLISACVAFPNSVMHFDVRMSIHTLQLVISIAETLDYTVKHSRRGTREVSRVTELKYLWLVFYVCLFLSCKRVLEGTKAGGVVLMLLCCCLATGWVRRWKENQQVQFKDLPDTSEWVFPSSFCDILFHIYSWIYSFIYVILFFGGGCPYYYG